jgi:hypothetical protein
MIPVHLKIVRRLYYQSNKYNDGQRSFIGISISDINRHLSNIFEESDFEDSAVFAKVVMGLELVFGKGRRDPGTKE